MRLKPDLVIAAGGTDAGASQSVMKLLEAVGLAAFLLPGEQRPDILFVGNRELQEEVKISLENIASINFAPNIRPDLDTEQLEASRVQLASLYTKIRARAKQPESLNWSLGREGVSYLLLLLLDVLSGF